MEIKRNLKSLNNKTGEKILNIICGIVLGISVYFLMILLLSFGG